MSDPYFVKTIPGYFFDGLPFVLTIAVNDPEYLARFRECTLIYSFTDANGITYQSKWEMIFCKKQPWPQISTSTTTVDIEVVLLATSPMPRPRGWWLGKILSPLPRSWKTVFLKLFRIKLTPVSPGQGGVYGSNDEAGTAASQAVAQGAQAPNQVVAQAAHGRFRKHFENESWLVRDKGASVLSFQIQEL
jgi:hypothetical protein